MPNSGIPGYETSVYDTTEGVWGAPPPPKPDTNCYILDLPYNVREMVAQKAVDMRFTDPMHMNVVQWERHMNELGSIKVSDTKQALLLLERVGKLHIEQISNNIWKEVWSPGHGKTEKYGTGPDLRRPIERNLQSFGDYFGDGNFLEAYDFWQTSRTGLIEWMDEMHAHPYANLTEHRERDLRYHINEVDRQFRRVREMVEGLSVVEGDYLPVLAARKSRAVLKVLSTKEERFQNRRNSRLSLANMWRYEWKPRDKQRVFIIDPDGLTPAVATGRSEVAELVPEAVEHFERWQSANAKATDAWKRHLYYETIIDDGGPEHGNICWMGSHQLIPRK